MLHFVATAALATAFRRHLIPCMECAGTVGAASEIPQAPAPRPEPEADLEAAEAAGEAAAEAAPLLTSDEAVTPAGSDTTTDSRSGSEAGLQWLHDITCAVCL